MSDANRIESLKINRPTWVIEAAKGVSNEMMSIDRAAEQIHKAYVDHLEKLDTSGIAEHVLQAILPKIHSFNPNADMIPTITAALAPLLEVSKKLEKEKSELIRALEAIQANIKLGQDQYVNGAPCFALNFQCNVCLELIDSLLQEVSP